MGLGLQGHLKALAKTDLYSYLCQVGQQKRDHGVKCMRVFWFVVFEALGWPGTDERSDPSVFRQLCAYGLGVSCERFEY